MVTVTFNQNELDDLQALIDAGVRASGLPAVKVAAALVAKLEAAVAEFNAQNAKEENSE